jgi:xanthine/CO dehydrogenase XdhC/CoxF family maturation factor
LQPGAAIAHDKVGNGCVEWPVVVQERGKLTAPALQSWRLRRGADKGFDVFLCCAERIHASGARRQCGGDVLDTAYRWVSPCGAK